MIRRLVVFVIVLGLTIPAAIVMTIFMMPFFSWIETRFGVEAVGHSGPAEWCYVSVYVTMLAGLTAGTQRLVPRMRPGGRGVSSSSTPKART
jgi:hypothetical protein